MRRTSSLILPALLLAACAGDEITDPARSAPVAKTPAGAEVQSAAARISVVMRGLNAPRGLALGPDGGLYVAEAGTRAVHGPCASVARGDNCYSGTGSVSRLLNGRQERLVTGLPSVFNPDFGDIIGPQDIGFAGRRAFVSIGWGGDPAARAQLGRLSKGLGWLIGLRASGRWFGVADIAAVETSHNPAGGPFDSNPFGLLVEGDRQFVADAGGNSLLRVSSTGQVSAIATFPPTPAAPPFNQSDAVPTEVQRGPNGGLFVSTLSGVPFAAGAAKIYRVVAGGAPRVYADAFKTITDFTFGPDGSLYVLEYASSEVFLDPPGRVVHVARNGARTVITSDRIQNPTGILVDRDGVIYVSNRGDEASLGQVLKIVP